MKQLKLVIAVFFLISPFAASADLIYQVDRVVGNGSVVGTITTDGSIGTLTSDDIIAWSLTLDDGNGTVVVDSATHGRGGLHIAGSAFSASLTELLWNFASNSFGHFQINLDSAEDFWCFASDSHCGLSQNNYEIVVAGHFSSGYAVTQHDGPFVQVASRVDVPEPGTLALLGLGLAGMGMIRRKKKV